VRLFVGRTRRDSTARRQQYRHERNEKSWPLHATESNDNFKC
jgi:hypothetical protein